MRRRRAVCGAFTRTPSDCRMRPTASGSRRPVARVVTAVTGVWPHPAAASTVPAVCSDGSPARLPAATTHPNAPMRGRRHEQSMHRLSIHASLVLTLAAVGTATAQTLILDKSGGGIVGNLQMRVEGPAG